MMMMITTTTGTKTMMMMTMMMMNYIVPTAVSLRNGDDQNSNFFASSHNLEIIFINNDYDYEDNARQWLLQLLLDAAYFNTW